MRAAVFRKCGPPSVLEVVTDWPKPVRQPGQLLVKMECTSVNPLDWKIRKGDVPSFLFKLPKILGGDVAGTVVEADAGCKFKAGDRVFGLTSPLGIDGTCAEYTTIKDQDAVAVPDAMSWEQAGGIPLTALTAYQALEGGFPLQGKRVLVHAGAGGVGSYCVQIAKAMGAYVVTTCSGRNTAFVTEELGADEACDYTKDQFHIKYKEQPFDVVVDLIGGDYEWQSLAVLRRDGYFGNVLNTGYVDKYGTLVGGFLVAKGLLQGKAKAALGLGPKYASVAVHPSAEQLGEVAELVAAGKLKPVIDRVLPLERIAEAHEYMEQGRARGKVVIKVAAE